jgi:hypothetical protein
MQEGPALKEIRHTQLQVCPKKNIKKNSTITLWRDHILSFLNKTEPFPNGTKGQINF